MSRTSPKYRITPSLLNSYQNLLDSDDNWEQFYGGQEDPSITSEDYYKKCEQELLDAINRVPFVSEAASKGTALNELVDCLVDKRKQREDMTVERIYQPEDAHVIDNLIGLRAGIDGFSFPFDIGLVRSLADYFNGASCQYRCEALLDTSFGPIIVYGDADYIRKDVVYDLKSTGKYSYPKFDKGWQKHLYPYALLESGDLQSVSEFEYTMAELKGGNSKSPLITGDIYRERYDFHFEESKLRLRETTEGLISWVEAHRNLITHPRIFNEE